MCSNSETKSCDSEGEETRFEHLHQIYRILDLRPQAIHALLAALLALVQLQQRINRFGGHPGSAGIVTQVAGDIWRP